MPSDYALKDGIGKYPLKLPSKSKETLVIKPRQNTLIISYGDVYQIFGDDVEYEKSWTNGREWSTKNHNFSANGGVNNER